MLIARTTLVKTAARTPRKGECMKYVVSLILSAQLLSPAAFAGEVTDTVLKVLKSSSEKTALTVEEETFVFNINGYGCQWPGLRVLNMWWNQN